MIGISLSPGILTQTPNQAADRQLLDSFGGVSALLKGFADMGVGAIEMRSVRPDTPEKVTAACADAILSAGLRMTIHATLADMPAKAFFRYLMPALKLLPADHPVVPLTVHSLRTGSLTLDRSATVRMLRALGDYAKDHGLNVVLALENNRIHTPGLSIMECDGVAATVLEADRDNVGTCFDFGHLYSNFLTYPECTPFLPPDSFLKKAAHTHIHGVTGITHWPLTGDNLPLEDYLRHLRVAGYAGICNLELESGRFWRDIDPREGFEMSVRALKDTLNRLEEEEKA